MWIIRLFAGLLFLMSVHQAWAGVWLYRGQQAIKRNDFLKASEYFKKSIQVIDRNPALHDQLGRSLYSLSGEDKNPSYLQEALDSFTLVTERTPMNGRGWLYRAMIQLRVEQSSEEGLTSKKFDEIKGFLMKAIKLEPGSSWVAFKAGKTFLAGKDYLHLEEKALAMQLLEQSILIHFPNPDYPYLDQSAPLLRPVLEVLWSQKIDLGTILERVPKNRSSYKTLIDFMRKKGFWESIEEVDLVYMKYQKSEYREACEKGEGYLEEGRADKAFQSFRKAFWMQNWSYPWAKAGILISQDLMNDLFEKKHSLFQEDYHETLRNILENEDDEIGDSLKWLGPVIEKTGDSYLRGLHAFRRSNFKRAIKELEKAPHDKAFRRRYLAASYWEIGQSSQAISHLQPALNENQPDVRELILLRDWMPEESSLFQKKISEVSASKRSSAFWWGDDFDDNQMNHEGRLTMGIHLKPGWAEIKILTRNIPTKALKKGFIRIMINGKPLKQTYVDHDRWQWISVKMKTSGGKRWLQVESLKTVADSDQKPIIELGPVKVAYEKNFI